MSGIYRATAGELGDSIFSTILSLTVILAFAAILCLLLIETFGPEPQQIKDKRELPAKEYCLKYHSQDSLRFVPADCVKYFL